MSRVFTDAIETAFVEVRADDRGDGGGVRMGRIVLAVAEHLGELFGGEIGVQIARGARRLANWPRRAAGLALADAAEEQVADLAEGSLGVLRVGLVHGATRPASGAAKRVWLDQSTSTTLLSSP